MATSRVGPCLVDRAFSAAPVPRPPQPTRARLTMLLSPAYSPDRPNPVSVEATAKPPVALRASRRVGAAGSVDMMFLSRNGGSEQADGPARRVADGTAVGGMGKLSGAAGCEARGKPTDVRPWAFLSHYFFSSFTSTLRNVMTEPGSCACSAKCPFLYRYSGSSHSMVLVPFTRIVIFGPTAITSCVNHSSGLCGALSMTVILSL